MAELPLILAGPIVRRVEARSQSFWVALREPADVTVTIFVGPRSVPVPAGAPQIAEETAPTTRLGDKLHIALVTIKIPAAQGGLSPRERHSYNMSFAPRAGATFNATDLAGEEMLKDQPPATDGSIARLALGYQADELPGFMSPPDRVDQIRLAQASCRKPHGSRFDAMGWLDDHIESTKSGIDEIEERPQFLFLTGDQIYADEVAGCLLPVVAGLAQDLMGGVEKVEINAQAVDATIEVLPAQRRQKLMNEDAGFTSSAAHSHLITFGEFAAMYLLAWNPAVWRELATPAQALAPSTGSVALKARLTDLEACAASKEQSVVEHLAGGLETQNKAVAKFRLAVPKVARAMANCATYMTADDHEITDDWNLNKEWQNGVFTKPLGRQIVRNGVMAYTFFQAWGNDPATFEKGKSKELRDETVKIFATPGGPFPAAGSNLLKVDELVGLTATPANQATFSFKIDVPDQTPAEYRIIGLDTRTRRTFVGQGIKPPALLGDDLVPQVPNPQPGFTGTLIVVSPAPVLSPFLIDVVGQPILSAEADIKLIAQGFVDRKPCDFTPPEGGAERRDVEGWTANQKHFEAFLARLALYKTVVILSGDVHHAASLTMDYWRKGIATPSRFVQFTCSPSHNSFDSTIEGIQRSAAQLQDLERGPDMELLGWNAKSSISIADGEHIPPPTRARLNRTPAMVPNRDWPTGTTIPADKPPDWRWRLRLIRDLRPDSVLPDLLQPVKLIGSDLDKDSTFEGLQRVAARHSASARGHFDHLRQLVFTPNVGVVDFASATGDLQVRHTLLSMGGPELNAGTPNTVHETELVPTAEDQPELRVVL